MMRSRICVGIRCCTAYGHETGKRSRDGDQHPEQDREDEAGDGGGFERDGDRGVVEVAVQAAAEVGDGFDAMQDCGGEQEGE